MDSDRNPWQAGSAGSHLTDTGGDEEVLQSPTTPHYSVPNSDWRTFWGESFWELEPYSSWVDSDLEDHRRNAEFRSQFPVELNGNSHASSEPWKNFPVAGDGGVATDPDPDPENLGMCSRANQGPLPKSNHNASAEESQGVPAQLLTAPAANGTSQSGPRISLENGGCGGDGGGGGAKNPHAGNGVSEVASSVRENGDCEPEFGSPNFGSRGGVLENGYGNGVFERGRGSRKPCPAVVGLEPVASVDHVARVDWSLLEAVPGERVGSVRVTQEEEGWERKQQQLKLMGVKKTGRRHRGPNWTPKENRLFLQLMELQKGGKSPWKAISDSLKAMGCDREAKACEDHWGVLLADLKKFENHFGSDNILRDQHFSVDSMSPEQRSQNGLPRVCEVEWFEAIARVDKERSKHRKSGREYSKGRIHVAGTPASSSRRQQSRVSAAPAAPSSETFDNPMGVGDGISELVRLLVSADRNATVDQTIEIMRIGLEAGKVDLRRREIELESRVHLAKRAQSLPKSPP